MHIITFNATSQISLHAYNSFAVHVVVKILKNYQRRGIRKKNGQKQTQTLECFQERAQRERSRQGAAGHAETIRDKLRIGFTVKRDETW